jgi:hypothetical protein
MMLVGRTQNIVADFGQSTASRFNEIELQSSEIDFSGDSYLTTLSVVQNADRLNTLSILTHSGVLDVSTLDMNNSLTYQWRRNFKFGCN